MHAIDTKPHAAHLDVCYFSRGCSQGNAPYVELDLACGIFDLKDEAAVEAAERSLILQREAGGCDPESSAGGSESSDEETDGDDHHLSTEISGALKTSKESGSEDSPDVNETDLEGASARRHPGIQEIT
jgi:hypothetical protein